MTDRETGERIRLDKWLWHARFFKTRTLAANICRAGKIRVDGTIVSKASHILKGGEVLTFPKADTVLVVRMLMAGVRRGPASEAQTLYEDLTPLPLKDDQPAFAERERGSGRPTKADRRAIDKLTGLFD